jgi:hypothetical protein
LSRQGGKHPVGALPFVTIHNALPHIHAIPFVMVDTTTSIPIGQQISLPGHFNVPVVLEAARPLAKGFECRVRLPDGTLEETVISQDEARTLAGTAPAADAKMPLPNADQIRLLVESARIRLA